MLLWAGVRGHVGELARGREFHVVHGVSKGVQPAPVVGIGARLYTTYFAVRLVAGLHQWVRPG